MALILIIAVLIALAIAGGVILSKFLFLILLVALVVIALRYVTNGRA